MNTKSKQIGFLAAMSVSVGSTIGAGIFFKNSIIFTNVGGNVFFMIASWVVAACGVLAIGLSLIEMSSALKSNAGISEYTSRFTKKWFAKFNASYMIFISLPVNYFALPVYAVMALQDAMQSANPALKLDGWEVLGIAFGFACWFVIVSYFRRHWALRSQWLFTMIKFLPLLIAPMFALVHINHHGVNNSIHNLHATGLTSLSPWLGIIASTPAILFAFDGFYTVTSVRSNLRKTKSMGPIVALSLAIIVAVYLFFGITTGVSGSKNIHEIGEIPSWLMTFFNVAIMFAVFGIINGFAIATPQVYEDTYHEHAIGFLKYICKYFKSKSITDAAFIASCAFGLIGFLIFGPIGIYAVNDISYASYGSHMGIYELTDYITNYTSLLVFFFIGVTIFGALTNRWHKRIEVTRYWLFIPSAIISIIFLLIATLYIVVSGIMDMTGFRGADVLTSTIEFVVMVLSLMISIAPVIYDLLKKSIMNKRHQVEKDI